MGIAVFVKLMHWNRRITCGGKGPLALNFNAMHNESGTLQDVPGLRRIILWLGNTCAAQKKLGKHPEMHKLREGRCLPGPHVRGACLEHLASCFTIARGCQTTPTSITSTILDSEDPIGRRGD